jgi:amino acid adenylation domain-containing protein
MSTMESERLRIVDTTADDRLLSQNQRLIWLGQQLAPDVPLYEMVHLFTISGPIDPRRFIAAFRSLVDETESLRTAFSETTTSETLRLHSRCVVPCQFADLSDVPDSQAAMRQFVESAMVSRLSLASAMYDSALLKLSDTSYCWYLKLHHLLTDGLNGRALLSGLESQYLAIDSGQPAPPACQYSAYPEYERTVQESPGFSDHMAWWDERSRAFAGSRFYRGAVSFGSFKHDRVVVRHGTLASDRLREIAKSSPFRSLTPAMSLFNIFASALFAWLGRIENQDDICIGVTSHGRTTPQFRDTIGLFMQLLPFRVETARGETFETLSKKVSAEGFGFFRHAVPGVTLPASQKSFDVALNVLDLAVDHFAGHPTSMDWFHNGHGDARRRLTVSVRDLGATDGFELIFDFNRSAFSAVERQRAIAQFGNVLNVLASRPQTRLDEIDFITHEEHAFFDTHLGSFANPPRGNVWDLFESTADLVPDRLAVRYVDGSLSFGQLRHRACELATRIDTANCGPVVPLLCSRDVNAVIGMLGILASGRCFLPVDMSLPEIRIQDLLRDSGALHAVDARSHCEVQRLTPETDVDSRLAIDACYLLYTSGSTGRPNAVVVGHESLLNLLQDIEQLAPLENVHCGWWTNVGFDVAIYEVFSALLFGRMLCIPSEHVRTNADELFDWMVEQRIQSAYLPPFFLAEFETFARRHPDCRLHRLLVGVEPIPQRLLASIAGLLPELRLVNGYGPTETTICATLMLIDVADQSDQPASIGRPVNGNVLRIVDANRRPVPVGVAGELLIAGVGVARGYFGKSERTEERFVRNGPSEMTWYRTGDRVRLREDGNLQFLGRVDSQIKIRGHRIEPAEVAAAIVACGPSDCAVIAIEGELVAFVADSASFDVATLRNSLLSRLPRYMLPSRFIPLPRLPRTNNGKPDLPSLQSLANECRGTRLQRTRPRNQMETRLTDVWKQVLNLPDLGATDDFFESGGDSLDAMKVVVLAEKHDLKLAIADLFRFSTVAALAAAIADHDVATAQAPVATDCPTDRETNGLRCAPATQDPLTAGQRGLLYLAQTFPESHAYHLQVRFEVRGQLDIRVADECLAELVRRHESLRTSYAVVDGQPTATVGSPYEPVTARHDLTQTAHAEATDAIQRITDHEAAAPFDLSSGKLLRVVWIRSAAGDCCLILTTHHIAVDQHSMGILLEEFEQLYRARCADDSDTITEPGSQFTAYARWKNSLERLAEREKSLTYWQQQLQDCDFEIDLPFDRPVAKHRTLKGDCFAFSMPSELTERTIDLARTLGVTLNVLLLSAFQVLLHRYSGSQKFVVGVPITDRHQARFDRTVGYCVESIPFVGHIHADHSFERTVSSTHERFVSGLSHTGAATNEIAGRVQRMPGRRSNALFHTMFVTQQTLPVLRPDERVSLAPSVTPMAASKFDLTMFVSHNESVLDCVIEYSTDRFDLSTIQRMAKHWTNLLEAMTAVPDAAVGDIDFLATEDRLAASAVAELKHTTVPSVAESQSCTCVHHLIEMHGRQSPRKTAVVCEERSLSYQQLNAKADRIASQLVKCGVRRDVPVGLVCERSPDAIVGIVAIMKAGGAWVPLNPHQPPERVRQILGRVGARHVLIQSHLSDRVDGFDGETIVVHREDRLTESRQDRSTDSVDGDSLAYVIHTSGSTGTPNGVEVTHDALMRSTCDRLSYYATSPQRFLLLSPVWFDSSVAGIFWTLCAGGTLVLPRDGRQQDIQAIARDFARHQVTHTLCLPSYYRLLLTHAKADQLSTLQTVVVAGECCTAPVAAEHFSRLPAAKLYNEYGPTEASVWATVHAIQEADESPIPIGRSVGDATVHVLDSRLRPVPIGVAGELYIGGTRLARGYRNNPELTQQRFVECPSFGAVGGRLYRTGDRAKRLSDGTLIFLGRSDDQIKVNGHRIEPGEIESVLVGCSGVSEVVVGLAKQPGVEAAAVLDRLKTLPFAIAEQLVAEAEAMADVAVSPDPTFLVESESAAVQVRIVNEEFIAPPRDRQRKWLINQVLKEAANDLQALDDIAQRMVPGSDAPHLPKDLQCEQLAEQEIMEDWQTPLMQAMAEFATETHGDVLEIGFGRGVSATMIQDRGVRSHTIVEANPFSISDYFVPWRTRFPDREIRLVEGRWQDVIDQLGSYDSVFFHAFPMNETEFVQYVADSATFAEHFFATAAQLLRRGGVFTYLTTEIDSLSRRHQRSLFRHFREVKMSVQPLSVPKDTRDAWWADSMIVLRATT